MSRAILPFLLVLPLLPLMACSALTNDQLQVDHDDVILPVQVRGNVDDGTLLLYETGGPWGGGLEERVVDYQYFSETLEPHVGIAYYDRRGYGNAYGQYKPDDISVDAYVADLDAVLRVVQERYEPERIVLMGHSWGGFITGRYLVDRGSERVDAWISAAGAVVTGGDDAYVPFRRDFVCRVSADRLEAGDTRADWAGMQDWCDAHLEIDPESDARDELWDHLNRVYELVGDPPIRTGPLLSALFGSSYNVTDSLMTPNEISLRVYEDTREMDLLSELGAVDVPTLFVAGELDDVIPTEVADAAAAIVPDAIVVEIPDAGHYVTWPDPQPFADDVLGFLDSL